jgi:acyl homoserine lactone synthase
MNKKRMETRTENILDGVLELFDVSYDELKVTHSNELYRLRKKPARMGRSVQRRHGI